jgi:Domain of unknown function (DUF4440)
MADGLRETLDAWTRAVVERDEAAADELLAEGFVLTSAGGVASRLERADWLASLSSIESQSLDVLEYEERTFGDVGVANTLQRWSARRGERDLSGDYAIVDVFERREGSWRAAWRLSRKVA